MLTTEPGFQNSEKEVSMSMTKWRQSTAPAVYDISRAMLKLREYSSWIMSYEAMMRRDRQYSIHALYVDKASGEYSTTRLNPGQFQRFQRHIDYAKCS